MSPAITCPTCGETRFDVCKYESMMVLREDVALFTLKCPHCASSVSAVNGIPPQLREEVKFAAIELGAGMGKEN